MSTINQSQLLQMRTSILNQNEALRGAAGSGSPAETAAPNAAPNSPFVRTMTEALQAVSNQQAKSSDLSTSYERGETNDIVSVMIERQKASLSFEATLQVRNKLLSAYREIMNMPV